MLLYEIFSLGLEPYENMAAVDIKKHLEYGERLPRPHHSSDDMCEPNIIHYTGYVFSDELMRTCWHAKPRDRPSFVELHNRIDEMSTTVAADSYNYCDAESSLENLEL